jgi:hypothetical protein
MHSLSRLKTDLKVSFDDGSVMDVHALILVLASPVFSSLLTTEDGGLRSTLRLPNKNAEEFTIFMHALLPASMRFSTLKDEATYATLCRWADEFEVEALRTLCEDHLMKERLTHCRDYLADMNFTTMRAPRSPVPAVTLLLLLAGRSCR